MALADFNTILYNVFWYCALLFGSPCLICIWWKDLLFSRNIC